MFVMILPQRLSSSLSNNTASTENLSNLVFPGLSGKRYVGDYSFFPPVNDINVILILLQHCINIILILH